MATINESQKQVNISNKRYIELLEAENGLYRIQAMLSGVATEAPAVSAYVHPQTVKPYVSPFSGCKINAVTQRIHDTGISTKEWAKRNGFKAHAVRSVICGNISSKSIRGALIRDGFMLETAPC
jgi:gp16 family phage-associated protein